MGITLNDVRFLLNAKREGVSFRRTLTLGRLHWYVRPASLAAYAARTGTDLSGLATEGPRSVYSDAFFTWLGAERLDSMDVSDYEGATVMHDLNTPIPDALKGSYSVVFDGGTLEHIFNFPQAVRNCMEMVEVGGHFLGCCPTNNEMGHGFYQFSPELWFRVLGPENGFTVEHMLIYALHDEQHGDELYEVADPRQVGERVILVNDRPSYLLIQARRTKVVPLFTEPPQQSDYSTAWAHAEAEREGAPAPVSMPVRMYRTLVPKGWRDTLYALRMRNRRSIRSRDLGKLDAKHYTRFHPK